ncbi:MAG: YDG domain-containing protein, partial [Oceanicaulis sp.]|nr:YDG domain-containing protein [Oceanicaulis sp.]
DLSISDDLTTAQALSGLGSVQVGGAASLGAGISSSGAQTFDGAVILTDDVTLASGSGDLALNQTVDGAHALTLNSDGTTTLGGAVNTVSLATNAGGTTALNGGAVTTSGSQAYGNTVTLGSNTALTANSVSFADTVTGNGHDLSVSDDLVTANALSGLGSLQVGGTSSLGGSVAGTGAQHYEGAVTLTNAVVLDSDTADITFDSGVSGAHALTLNSTGTTMLGGTVNTSSVMSNAGGTLVVSGGSITTTGAQTYGNDLGLTTDTTFTGENITFNGAIRSQGAEAHNLQVTDAGDAVFNGALGSSALNNVTIEANSVTLSDGDIEGDLNVTASTGAIVTQGAGVLEVGGDANLQAATGITLDGALRVVGDLLLKAQGLISQSAALEVTGTTTLDVRGAGLGDVLLANSLDTLLAETLVGGDLRIEGTDLITQVDGTTIRVRGAFDPDGATLDFDTLAENIVAVAASIGGNLIRGIGEIVLEVVGGELQASVDGNVIATGVSLVGDVFVQSLAGGLQFDGPALAGDAILLGNAANALTGEVSILTDAPDVITSVAVRTGISQVNTLSVAGTLNLLTEQSPVAGSGQITLDNADNQFGALAINGRNATISQQGTMTLRLVSIAESLSLTADAVTQVSGLAASATNLVLNVLNSASLTEANTIGAASGVIGGHLALQNQGALTLGDGVTGLSADDGMLVSISAGDLTLANQVSSVDGDLVLVAGDNFINNAGASALNVTGTGSWQVWSQEPEADALGGLVPDFIQYNANFGSSSVLGVGNGLLYTLAPELDVALVGEVRRTYDQTTDAALQQSNYQVNGGALASITFSFSSDGAYDSANAGEGKTVTVANLVLDSAVRDDNVAIFGFGLVDTTVSADIGVIDRALITAVNGIVATARQYDGTNNVTLDGHSASFTGLLSGDDLTLATLSGQFADINAGTGVQVDVTDISLGGAAASNYQLDVSVAIPVTGDILQRSLDLTGSRVYDGTTDALAADLALGNLVGTETLVLSGMGSLADRNAADGKLVNVSGLNLADGTGLASNYTFTGGTHTLDVTRREVTVSGITASDRIYDGTTDATVNIAGVLFDNIVSGDTLTVSATGTFDSRNVGSDRTVTLASSYSGADAGNYVFVDQASTTASITPRAISVSGITAQDRIYDGTTDAVVDVSGVTFANAIAGDD